MYICFKCNEKFPDCNALINHFKYEHLLSSKGLKVCCKQNDCNQSFTDFKSFRRHFKCHQKELEKPLSAIPLIPPIAPLAEPTSNNNSESLPQPTDISQTSLNTNTNQNIFQSIQNLKRVALKLSLTLHNENSMPRKRILEIQNMITHLLSSISTVLMSTICYAENHECIEPLLEFCRNPFNEIRSEHRLFKILQEMNLYEPPKCSIIEISISCTTANGNPTLGPRSTKIYVMPLEFTFKSIFQIPNLLDITLKNIENNLTKSMYCNFVNGSIYKAMVQKYPPNSVIPYILYVDDYQVNNPLGSHTYSISGCYCSFPNMPDFLLSQLKFIFNVAFISSKDLKKIGPERAFEPLVQELKKLEDGIVITTPTETRKIHFILGLVVGDNLAVNNIMGFVESFNSKRYCRVCCRTKSEMRNDTNENVKFIRNKNSYENDLSKQDFRETGVKRNCVFHMLSNFHVTERFSFDLMHDIFEGVCSYDLCHVILALINDNVISLDVLNSRKTLFKYGASQIGNLSSPLVLTKIKAFNLKMSASEVSCFICLLPIMIGDLIPRGNKHWQLLITLVQFIDFAFKSQYTTEDLIFLRKLVAKHHSIYIELYGPLKPKHHFMVHYATAIEKCGPLKYTWCMRYEGKHKEAKDYLRNVSSRVNPERTMSTKSSLKFAHFLLEQENVLQYRLSFESSYFLNLKEESYFSKIICHSNIEFESAEMINKICYKNTIIKKNDYMFCIDNSELFKIHSFLYQNDCIYVLCFDVSIVKFDDHYQAYVIDSCNEDVIYIKDISAFITYPISIHISNNCLKYARKTYY